MPNTVFEFKYYADCVTYFCASSKFFCYWSSSRNTWIYFPTTCAYPTVEFSCFEKPLFNVNALLHYTNYYIIQLHKLFNLYLPVMNSVLNRHISKNCLVFSFWFFVGCKVIIQQRNTMTFLVNVPCETLLTNKNKFGFMWNFLIDESLI